MIYSAKSLSDAIRMKRKKLKDDGVANMVDTKAIPQMDPNGIAETKEKAQIEETLDVPEKSMAPDDPADSTLDETQTEAGLAKRMRRVKSAFGKLKK